MGGSLRAGRQRQYQVLHLPAKVALRNQCVHHVSRHLEAGFVPTESAVSTACIRHPRINQD